MKTLYLFRTAPNPRKVICLMKAKGLTADAVHDITVKNYEISEGQHLTEAFTSVNPLQLLPVLVLEDGTVLNDSQAVCEYLDRVYGERSIMGNDIVHRAKVCAVRRTAEFEIMYNFMLAFQHGHPSKAHRVDQVSQFAPKSIQRAVNALPYFEQILTGHEYLVNDQLSFADIVLYLGLDFGKVMGVDPRDANTVGSNIVNFYERMHAEYSIKACTEGNPI